jgi:hypothetical protein
MCYTPSLVRSFLHAFVSCPLQIFDELEGLLGNSMEDVLDVVRSSLAAWSSSSLATVVLEIENETPARAHVDMDLDAPLWEVDANEEKYVDDGEGVGI